MNLRSDNRGMALVEATLVLTVLVTMVSMGFAILYFSFARVYLAHAVYESTICLASDRSSSKCEDDLRSRARTALPIGEIRNVSLRKNPRASETRLSWEIGGRSLFEIHERTALPLRGTLQ